jgi:hypothetical protein
VVRLGGQHLVGSDARVYYGGRVHWATIITSAGALLGGLAIVLFIQLGAQRQDRLRAQVNQIGRWAETADVRTDPDQPEWRISLFIRNSSELPLEALAAILRVQERGYDEDAVHQFPDGVPLSVFVKKKTGSSQDHAFRPGTIPPGITWEQSIRFRLRSADTFDVPEEPKVTIIALYVTDAAGHKWDLSTRRAGPPRRILRLKMGEEKY